MPRVLRVPLNTAGRDFVVGDIHGAFDLLASLLAKVEFDADKDRLFSVGDLIDRGPDSILAAGWLDLSWFYCVRGNHEQLAIDGLRAAAMGNPAWAEVHVNNGGLWFWRLPLDERQKFVSLIDQLPYVIEVETANGLVGIVHAEPKGDDWPAFVAELEAEPEASLVDPHEYEGRGLRQVHALWARNRYNKRKTHQPVISGVHRVIVGHTPVASPMLLGNIVYLDTGAGKKPDAPLAILELATEEVTLVANNP